MVYAPSTNLLNSYVLVDISDTEIDWANICMNIIAWKISVGDFHLDLLDSPDLGDGDIDLLFKYARMLLTDRDKLIPTSQRYGVPYIKVSREQSLEDVNEEVYALWHARHL